MITTDHIKKIAPYVIIILPFFLGFILTMETFKKIHDIWWLFYLIYLSIAFYIISYYEFTYNQIFNPSKYLKILYALISFSFLLISIIFGFHTDILVKYDNKNSDILYWFKVNNIMKFPLNNTNQYVVHDTLDFNNKDFIKNIHNYFIIDNSKSILKNDDTLRTLIKNERRPIRPDEKYVDSLDTESYLQISHLLMRKLLDNDEDQKNYYLDNNAWNDYSRNSSIELHNSMNIKTFLNIDNILNIDDSDEVYKRIFIVSDFNNLSSIDNVISSFNSSNKDVSKILSINLIKLNSVENKTRNNNSIDFHKDIINNQGIKNRSLINYINITDDQASIKLNYITSNISDKNIHIHFTQEDNENEPGSIKSNFTIFDTVNQSSNYSFFILAKDDSFDDKVKCVCKKNSFPINSVYMNRFDFAKIENIDGNDKIEFNFDNYTHTNQNLLNFEFFSKKNHLVYKLNATKEQKLTKSNSIALIVIYTILFASLSLIFTSLCYSSILKNDQKLSWMISHLLISVISMVPITYFIFLGLRSGQITVLAIVVLIILFTGIHYKKSLN